MRLWPLLTVSLGLAACSGDAVQPTESVKQDVASSIDGAPYAPVTEAESPTVAALESQGYMRVDYYPVGCIIPDQPEAACDATGAEFLDQSEMTYDDYDQYEYVCPATPGVEIDEWQCRKQRKTNN